VQKKLFVYVSALILWGLIGCEFEVPTMPRLPARWNSKVIIPLLDKTYSFLDMVYDSTADQSNPIYADTSFKQMYYLAENLPGQSVPISPDYWKIPALSIQKRIDLASINAQVNNPVPVYRTDLLGEVSTQNNQVIKGLMNSDAGAAVNSIRITATLSDSLANDLDIAVVARNFYNVAADTVWFDTLSLAANVLENTLTLAVEDDSVLSLDRISFVDSLAFAIAVQIQDTLREPLNQDLDITIEVGEISLNQFYGSVNAFGNLSTQEFISSPIGADSIQFEGAVVDFSLANADGFESIIFVMSGKKQHVADTIIDSVFTVSGTAYELNIGRIMANLPDSITFYVEASLVTDWYNGSTFENELTIGYRLYAPLRITLPVEIQLAAANPTRFFITDSLTRSNVSRSQNGAQFDISVTNRTPFSGSIYLLIGNHREFPTDSVEADRHIGYEYINDTLYYIAADTEMVLIDTLAIIDLPLAQMRNDTLLYAGVGDLFYMADSSALALLADTCYILPKFYLTNPDTTQVLLRSNYSIGLKTYMNLLFDPSVLIQTETDTMDTTG